MMSKSKVTVYYIEEYDDQGRSTGREYFATTKERAERLEERKSYPYGTDKWKTGKIILPNKAHQLNHYHNYSEFDKRKHMVDELRKGMEQIGVAFNKAIGNVEFRFNED